MRFYAEIFTMFILYFHLLARKKILNVSQSEASLYLVNPYGGHLKLPFSAALLSDKRDRYTWSHVAINIYASKRSEFFIFVFHILVFLSLRLAFWRYIAG